MPLNCGGPGDWKGGWRRTDRAFGHRRPKDWAKRSRMQEGMRSRLQATALSCDPVESVHIAAWVYRKQANGHRDRKHREHEHPLLNASKTTWPKNYSFAYLWLPQGQSISSWAT